MRPSRISSQLRTALSWTVMCLSRASCRAGTFQAKVPYPVPTALPGTWPGNGHRSQGGQCETALGL